MSEFSDVVVVYASQGAGKSLHAEALQRMFGCRTVVDGWDGVHPVPAGALVLTNLCPGDLTVTAAREAA